MKNKLLKIKRYFSKIRRVSTLSKKEKYVWNDLIQLLDELQLNYSRNDAEKTIYLSMSFNEETTVVSFRISLYGRSLTVGALIIDNIDAEKTNDMLVLASHMNAMLPVGNVLVNASKGYVEYFLEMDICRLLLYPDEIYEGIHIHYIFTKDHILPTFQKMQNSWEDPIFVFSEFMEKYQNKNVE
jgi:hypothetical protein